jgi:hypothetical protein
MSKIKMTHREAIEIVLKAAKNCINGYGEMPSNARDPIKANRAIRIVEKSLAPVSNDARATSTWKCPDCGLISEGHTFSWMVKNGTVTCDCGTDMDLEAVVIDGVSQKV